VVWLRRLTRQLWLDYLSKVGAISKLKLKLLGTALILGRTSCIDTSGCRMRPWPQNTKRRWPLRAVECRVASVRSFSLPLAALWLDAVTLAAVWPAFLPGVDEWPPAQHDLAALWSPCLHVAPIAFHAAVSRRNGCSLAEIPSSRRRVAADASRRWLRLGHRRFTTFGRLSLAGARLRTTKTELTPQFRLKGPTLHVVRLPASNLERSSGRRSGTRVSARSGA
jgi:hypothetical protein